MAEMEVVVMVVVVMEVVKVVVMEVVQVVAREEAMVEATVEDTAGEAMAEAAKGVVRVAALGVVVERAVVALEAGAPLVPLLALKSTALSSGPTSASTPSASLAMPTGLLSAKTRTERNCSELRCRPCRRTAWSGRVRPGRGRLQRCSVSRKENQPTSLAAQTLERAIESEDLAIRVSEP